MIAACVYITPIFHAWYSQNVPSLSARVAVVGIVVGAFQIGDLLGWVAFWNNYYEARTVSSTSKGSKRSLLIRAAADEEAFDTQGLKIACGFLAVAVVGIFAVGAWQKYDNRRRSGKIADVADANETPVNGTDDAAFRWVD